MRWPWLKRDEAPEPEPAPAPPAFDALIDINPASLPLGVDHQTACAAVARAVARMPGGAWINVEAHQHSGDLATRVFPAGSGRPQDGEPWASLAAEVDRSARAAIAQLRAAAPAAQAGRALPPLITPAPFPTAAGFAETMQATQMDALAALTSLAQSAAPDARTAPDGKGGLTPTQQHALAAFALLAQEAQQTPASKREPVARATNHGPAAAQEARDGHASSGPANRGARRNAPIRLPPVAADAFAARALLEAEPPPAVVQPAVPIADPAAADIEIMTRLLGFVLPADPRDTAIAAVRRFGSFAAVLAAPETELRQVPGLGQHCVAAIKLAHAAAVRLARARASRQPVLDDPAKLSDYLAAALARERIEQFRILFLDERGMLRADEVQARGTVNHTPVYPREVVRRALELGASSLVLVHNHPSGNPEPSPDDLAMTKQVADAASVMGIVVRDHVIVGNGRWLSFKEQGLLG